jgi:hypothetical protein
MIDVRFVPLRIEAYPHARKQSERRPSTAFKSTYARTLDRLESELQRLGAVDIVVQAGFRREDIRNDGWPRSGASPAHPRIYRGEL